MSGELIEHKPPDVTVNDDGGGGDEDSTLWHYCRSHPYRLSEPCIPTCRAFCGARVCSDDGSDVEPTGDGSPEDCVVCVDLATTEGIF